MGPIMTKHKKIKNLDQGLYMLIKIHSDRLKIHRVINVPFASWPAGRPGRTHVKSAPSQVQYLVLPRRVRAYHY